jgi:uncharacterized OB-fold protein
MAPTSDGRLTVRDFPGSGELGPLLAARTTQSAPFFDALAEGRLVLQRCSDCARVRGHVAPVCPHCGGESSSWAQLDGRGVVHSWIRYRRSYLSQFDELVPYVVLCVQLEEGPRLFGRLVDDDGEDPTPGMRVQAVVERWRDGRAAPAFMRAGRDAG